MPREDLPPAVAALGDAGGAGGFLWLASVGKAMVGGGLTAPA